MKNLLAFLQNVKTKLSATLNVTIVTIQQYLKTIHISLLWSLDIAVRIIVIFSLIVTCLHVLNRLHILDMFKPKPDTPVITPGATVNNTKPTKDTVTTSDIDTTIKFLEDLGGKK